MKKLIFIFCIAASFANCMIAIWEHDIRLAAAWSSAFFGWLSALLFVLSVE